MEPHFPKEVTIKINMLNKKCAVVGLRATKNMQIIRLLIKSILASISFRDNSAFWRFGIQTVTIWIQAAIVRDLRQMNIKASNRFMR